MGKRGVSGGTYVNVMESRPPPAPARACAMLSLSCCCCCAGKATGAEGLADEDILLDWELMVSCEKVFEERGGQIFVHMLIVEGVGMRVQPRLIRFLAASPRDHHEQLRWKFNRQVHCLDKPLVG